MSDVIADGLAPYHAALDSEGFIQTERHGVTGVRMTIKRGRIRAESAAGGLLWSGPVTPEAVGQFVEKFWYWTKK